MMFLRKKEEDRKSIAQSVALSAGTNVVFLAQTMRKFITFSTSSVASCSGSTRDGALVSIPFLCLHGTALVCCEKEKKNPMKASNLQVTSPQQQHNAWNNKAESSNRSSAERSV